MSGKKYQDGQKTTATAKTPNTQRRQNNLRWLNGELSREDKQWLHGHLDDMAQCSVEIFNYVDEYTQVSCKFDTTSTKYLASLINRDNHPTNPNVALSVRATTPALALFALWYVFTQRYDGELAGSVDGETDDLF